MNRPTKDYLNIKLSNPIGLIATGFPAFTLRLKFTPVK